MSLPDHEFARRDAQGVELRPTPLRVHWRLEEVLSSDQHTLRIRHSASIRVPDDPTDRRVFAEVMLSRIGSITADHLAEHFRAALLAAAKETASLRSAAEWTSGRHRQQMLDAFQKAADGVAFSCGLQVLPPYQLEISSPSLDQQQRLDQRVVAQKQSLERARDLVRHFHQLRDTMPQASAATALKTLSPAEQSEMLAAILASASDDSVAPPLWIVSGTNLLTLEFETDRSTPRVIENLPELGPLRSIRVDQGNLLIGAQKGVHVVDSESGQITASYRSDVASDFGFNAVTLAGSTVYATHVEVGLIAWDAPDSPRELFRSFQPAAAPVPVASPMSVAYSTSGSRGAAIQGPRHLLQLNTDTLLFAVAGRLFACERGEVRLIDEGSENIVAILPDADRAIILRANGTVQTIDHHSLNLETALELHRDIRAAAGFPWMDSVRLLLADETGAVDCVGLDDAAVVRFASSKWDLRSLCASASVIAGLAADRQRLFLWSAAHPQQPPREVHISSLTRHRIAAAAMGGY